MVLLELLLVRTGQENGLLSFTTDTKDAMQSSDFLFICVGTPSAPDGAADLSYVMQVADAIARYMASRKVVATKSTVPVGTADAVRERIATALQDHRQFPQGQCKALPLRLPPLHPRAERLENGRRQTARR